MSLIVRYGAGGAPARPRSEAVSFYNFSPSAPNEYEKFFYSLLLCWNATLKKELDAWAANVVVQRAAAIERQHKWVPTGLKKNNVSTLFDPMEAAFKDVRDAESLAVIAAAMRFWDAQSASTWSHSICQIISSADCAV